MKNFLIIATLLISSISYGQLEKSFKSTKWNYTIWYPKEYSKSSLSSMSSSPMTELHLADGTGRSILIMSQPFSSSDANDFDKLTKEEMQSMLRRSYPSTNVFKFNKTVISGRKALIASYNVNVGGSSVSTIMGSIYNKECLIQIIISTSPSRYEKDEKDFLKIINSIKFY
jgi:hypothetical protein